MLLCIYEYELCVCAFVYVLVDNGIYADDCWLHFMLPDFTSQVGGSNGKNCAACRVPITEQKLTYGIVG